MIVNYYTCTKNYKDAFVKELNHITKAYDLEKEKEELKGYMNAPLSVSKSKSGSRNDNDEKKE